MAPLLYTEMDDVERALEQLYRSEYTKFETVLATLTGDRETARDAVQQACATALARRRQFRGDGSLQGWVWKIALRIAAPRPRGVPAADVTLEPRLSESVLDGDLARRTARAVASPPPVRFLAVLRRPFV
jgi:DNA-directed RNA polymerase specialized sigma24 family protein